MTEKTGFPIICLWCHPRSMSTAMERVMRERGDFECFHEPFMYDYYVHRRVRSMPHFDIEPGRPQNYNQIKNMLLEAANHTPVFIKDMSYYVIPALYDDVEFARRLKHSFLIRNPMHSILSYFKLDKEFTLEEIGIEAQWRHANWLQNTLSITPIVLQADQIGDKPQTVITSYWKHLGIDITPHAFDWNNQQAPQDWQQVSGWHDNVSGSQGIRKTNNDNDLKRQQEFETLANNNPNLYDHLNHHMPYYEKMKSLHFLMGEKMILFHFSRMRRLFNILIR